MKQKSLYVCKNCGYRSAKWLGRCPNCGEWGSFKEIDKNFKSSTDKDSTKPVRLGDIESSKSSFQLKGEFSGFFGNEIERGGVYLISGTPGVGKSTFLLQISRDIVESGRRVVYISAEESINQIASRAKRLKAENVEAVSLYDLNRIIYLIEAEKPDVAIIDSIHTVFDADLDYAVGGIQQVKHCMDRLINLAKRLNIAMFIVAHITKSGAIAGPKTLEHMVDAVLLLEGERKDNLRVLKFLKNRFGPTDEALILEMKENGLVEVDDPTLKFVKSVNETDGVAYGVVLEGRIPIILEVEALCVETPLAIPRRVSVGFDLNRLHMLIAVLEKRLNIPLFKYDVYLNVAGGLKVSSTLFDAAVCAAIISSFKKKQIAPKSVIFSEIDLAGNLRLFEKDVQIVEKIESLGFKTYTALNVKNIKGLWELID